MVEIVVGEQPVHEPLLLDADAVLARQHAAGVERGGDDLGSRCVDPLEHALLPAVVDQQRVQIAVAGVEDVHHQDVVSFGDRIDPLQHLRQS